MLASTGMKSWLAYKTLRKLNTRSVSSPSSQDSLIASSTLSKVTTPPSVAAATGAAYTLSKLTNTPKLQRFLLKSTLSASAAGLLNAGLKRLIGRKRPRAETGPEFKGPALKDKFNAMPSGHASAVAAVAGSSRQYTSLVRPVAIGVSRRLSCYRGNRKVEDQTRCASFVRCFSRELLGLWCSLCRFQVGKACGKRG